MNRRLAHVLCSFWLVATSLAPGSGWALCFEASGQVAVEMTGVAGRPAAADDAAADCATECPPDRCEDCRDVSLTLTDRACPRRHADTIEPAVTPLFVEFTSGPLRADSFASSPRLGTIAAASPHLTRVMRC